MTDLQIKDRLAYILLSAKVIVIGWIIFLRLAGDYNSEQTTIILVIIIPLFSMHLTVIIRSLIETRHQVNDDGAKLRSVVVIFSFIIPVFYAIYMVMLITLGRVFQDDFKFEELIALLGAGETIFGVYLGTIISSLFEDKKGRSKRKH